MSHKIFRWVVSLVLGLAMIATASAPRTAHAAGPWYVTPTGNDGNDCLSPGTACATINGTIAKAASGDTILLSIGTYTDSGSDVARIFGKSLTFSGGWDESFSTQSGMSVLDGQGVRPGITTAAQFSGMTISVERLIVQNGTHGIFTAGQWTIDNSIIRGNSGIGVWTTQGSMSLNNSSVTGNGGGGIRVEGGSATLNNNIISGNTASFGGGIFSSISTVTMNNTAVSNNTTNTAGGGVFLSIASTLHINNSTIAANTSLFGGGFYLYDGATLTINNSTIGGNTANTKGGGILQGEFPSYINTITVQNTILANNTSPTGPDCSGLINSSDHNIVGSTSGCNINSGAGDLFNIDPLLGSFLPVQGYFPLLSGSPAIDAGDNSTCQNVDQRGVTRPQGAICDMGAYEYTVPGPATALSVVSGDNQETITTLSFPLPLQAAALDSQGSPVSGVTIDFTAPASGASGIFGDTNTNSTSVITDEGGVATTSSFTANNQAGTYTVSASALGIGSVNFNLAQVDRPANDNFADAKVVTSLPFSETVDITNATNEPNEPQNCVSMLNTVWYSFTPTETIGVRVDTEGIGISSNLNVYVSSNLNILGCTLFSGPITFLAEAGQTYYFQAGALNGEVGGIQVSLEQIPPPGNDNFANATVIPSPLPFDDTVDTFVATLEAGEPTPSCAFNGLSNTVWYSFTSNLTGSISARNPASSFNPVLAVYTGNSLANLTEVGCQMNGSILTIHVQAGTTYYFQAGMENDSGNGGPMQFHVEVTPDPVADFFFNPSDPSVFDTILFHDFSSDPGETGFQSFTWDFGDGTSITGTESIVNHQYTQDGDYTVQHSVTTVDGRTDSTSQVVQVRTHDVGITKVIAPRSANSGQTKAITVSLRNRRYPETVIVDLYKSIPGGNEWIDSLTLQVPVLSGNRTTQVTFNYTFTLQDAQIGKVTFLAIVTIDGANDAFTQDNTGISSPPTQVRR